MKYFMVIPFKIIVSFLSTLIGFTVLLFSLLWTLKVDVAMRNWRLWFEYNPPGKNTESFKDLWSWCFKIKW